MIENPKNLTEQLLNLSERVATEMRVLNRTKVSTINGQVPDANGNVTVQTGGDTSNLVPKTGDRGVLAGYETLQYGTVVNDNSPDFQVSPIIGDQHTQGITVENGGSNSCWVKCVLVSFYNADFGLGFAVTLGDKWAWANDTAPEISIVSVGYVVCVWNGYDWGGFAFFVPAFEE